ncbi:MAG: hypothetical protein AAFX03_03145 [Pseudomonadota bacterium]
MIELDAAQKILLFGLAWLGVLLVAVPATVSARRGSVGLPIAFLLTMTLFHAGALVHLDPSYDHTRSAYLRSWTYTADTVALGLETAWLGVAAFTLGLLAANDTAPPLAARPVQAPPALRRAAIACLALGATATALSLSAWSSRLPGAAAAIAALQNLVIAGAAGWVVYFHAAGRSGRALAVAGAGALALPAFNLTSAAILADAAAAAIIVACVLVALRPKRGSKLLRAYALSGSILAIALAGAIAWLDLRDGFRSVAWHGGSVGERSEQLFIGLGSIRLRNTDDHARHERLDARLNQNVAIGKAVEADRAHNGGFEGFALIEAAALGWVPRAVWPDKPERGDTALLERHTGKRVLSDASFATGPVFEFYVAAGYWGVGAGLFGFGYLLRRLDMVCAAWIGAGDLWRAAPPLLAAIPLVTYSNSLLFIVNLSAWSAAIGAGVAGAGLWAFAPGRRAAFARAA